MRLAIAASTMDSEPLLTKLLDAPSLNIVGISHPDPSVRQNLERLLQQIEADSPASDQIPMMASSTLSDGAQLVTDVTTPDEVTGGTAFGGGSSPLMPQFGRRGGRR